MKLKSILASILLIALLLTACTPTVNDPTIDNSTTPTVQDIFNETTESTESSQATDATEETEDTTPKTVLLGGIGLGFGPEVLKDDKGSYMVYEGGEIEIPLKITTDGNIADKGVGILLFVDGKPQPYKTEAEPEYAFLHTFYQKPGFQFYDLLFTPVTGQEGDELEVYLTTVLYPTYSLSDGVVGMVYTSGSVTHGLRLKYEQTPSADTFPEDQLSLTNTTVSFVDTEAADIKGWSDADLRERIAYNFSVNEVDDMSNRIVPDVSSGEPVSLRYEVWGSPYVDFGLVIYVDNIPVFDAGVGDLMLDVQNGQTTVVEAQLNLNQFDGESVVYAVLVPRNYRTNEVKTSAGLTCTRPIFLVAESTQ